MRALAAILLSTVVLAGCLGGGDSQAKGKTPAEIEEQAGLWLSQDHGGNAQDHYNASLHASSQNVERVGYHNGYDNSDDPDHIPKGTYYTEIALYGDYAFLSRGSVAPPADADGIEDQRAGFVILSISDPSAPSLVSEYNTLTGGDIEVDRDGQLVFFSTQRNTIEEVLGNMQANRDPSDLPPRGIHIVDVSDKGSPRLAGYVPFPYNGPHTLTYYDAGTTDYLFVQTYDFFGNTVPSTTIPGGLPTPPGVVPVTQRVSVFEIQRDPSGNRGEVTLSQVAHFQILEGEQFSAAASGTPLVFPHDTQVQVHPLTGDTLAYVAYWDAGVRVVDVSDLATYRAPPAGSETPMLPEIGAWTEFSPSARNNIHFAKPFDHLIDGRHVTVAEPEIISADETGIITFIDTTLPMRPFKPCTTSYWELPGELVVQNLQFSPHNFDTWDGKVALAHNHAGLWIIDVSDDAKLCQPQTAGYYMDVKPRADPPRMQPYFWGVLERDGLLFAVDEASGLYVLRHNA